MQLGQPRVRRRCTVSGPRRNLSSTLGKHPLQMLIQEPTNHSQRVAVSSGHESETGLVNEGMVMLMREPITVHLQPILLVPLITQFAQTQPTL